MGNNESRSSHCSICFKDKRNRNPRTLPCQHSVCTECLVSWHDNRVNQQVAPPQNIMCPVCREITRLPSTGIKGLPIDIKFGKAAEQDDNDSSSAPFLCQVCFQKGVSKPVQSLCVDCSRRLCAECTLQHQQTNIFKSHAMVDDLCDEHGAEAKYVCLDCLKKLCVDCAMGETHQNHHMCGIKDSQKEITVKIQIMIREAKENLTEITSKVESEMSSGICNSKNVSRKFLKMWEDEKAKMDEHIKQLIRKHEEFHGAEVKRFYDQYNERVVLARSSIDRATKLLGSDKLQDLSIVSQVQTELLCDCLIEGIPSAIPETETESTCSLQSINSIIKATRECTYKCGAFDDLKSRARCSIL